MYQWEPFIKTLVENMGFRDYHLEIDEEHRHGNIYLYDGEKIVKDNLPSIVESLNHLFQLIAQKQKTESIYLDVNNYRKEREKLIIELSKAAARKVTATKQEIALPPMNSYERRLVHMEITTHPELKTESVGLGKERRTLIRHINLQ